MTRNDLPRCSGDEALRNRQNTASRPVRFASAGLRGTPATQATNILNRAVVPQRAPYPAKRGGAGLHPRPGCSSNVNNARTPSSLTGTISIVFGRLQLPSAYGALLPRSGDWRHERAGVEGQPPYDHECPVPFKAKPDCRHHIPKQRFKVTNWRVYDQSLRQRGSLTDLSP